MTRPDIHNVAWNCPNCHTLNHDDYTLTAPPWCEHCASTWYWDQILTVNQQVALDVAYIEYRRAHKEITT